MVVASGHAHLPSIKILHRDKFLTLRQFVPLHCASARHQICNRGYIRGSDQTCTATRVMLNKTCTWTSKTRAIPSLHRDSFLAKVPSRVLGTARMLRRVTQPPHIAGPLYVTRYPRNISLTA